MAADGAVAVEVSVDPTWLGAPGRAFPVTIDPFFAQRTSEAATVDTFVYQQAPTTAYASWPQLVIGLNGGNLYRSLLSFNLGSLPAAENYVTEAHLTLVNYVATTCTPTPMQVAGVGSAFTAATTWATQPPLDAAGVVSTPSFSHGATGCEASAENLDVTSLAQRWMGGGAANFGVSPRAADETKTDQFKVFYSGENASGPVLAPALSITYDRLPAQATAVAPLSGAVTTATPTLSVTKATDPDGDHVQYWFRATPATDAETGHKVIDSGWIDDNTFPPPPGQSPDAVYYPVSPGALSDGVTYYWHVWTRDPTTWRLPDPANIASLRVEMGLGAQGAQPYDTVGPARVNLATGNLVVGAGSPSTATVGGPMGLTYSYNSGAPSASAGLRASYFDDPSASRSFAAKSPVMVGTDANVNFAWAAEAPVPWVGADHFLIRWEGEISPPSPGSYTFYTTTDDGVRVDIGGSTVINAWSDGVAGVTGTATASAPVSFAAGERKAIKIEYYDHLGPAYMALSALGPSGPGGAVENFAVRPAWLSTAAPALPVGWAVSAGLQGQLSYVSARVSGTSVSLLDPSGARHLYSPAPGRQG